MKKLPPLDGLRSTSILLVVFAHLLPLGPKWLDLNGMAAAAGMALFFALSGFLITETLLSGQRVRVFLLRRAARILPLAYAYLLIIAVAMWPDLKTIAENALFLENYTFDWMLNGHFWSLCVEIHFYVTIAIVCAVGGPNLIRVLVPLACVGVTAIRMSQGAYIDIQTHLRVDEICAGGIVAIMYDHRVLPKECGGITFFFAAAGVLLTSHPMLGPLQYLRPYAAATLLASTIPLRVGIIRVVLTSRVAAYIAQISYALYVIHPITAFGYMNEGSILLKYAIKRPISLVATFFLAHLSTFYYENRWTDAAKRFSS
jgi:peptidoglycan/LPS O-acetylase OafA/YrhL